MEGTCTHIYRSSAYPAPQASKGCFDTLRSSYLNINVHYILLWTVRNSLNSHLVAALILPIYVGGQTNQISGAICSMRMRLQRVRQN